MNATATMVSAGPQRMRALERASHARFARAELKRRVAQGEIGVAEVILTRPWEAQRMTVADLLTGRQRWGHARVGKFLASAAMPENKTIPSANAEPSRPGSTAARLTPRALANGTAGPVTGWFAMPNSSPARSGPRGAGA